MCRTILSLLVFIFISTAIADTATQTDWSGGSGTYGPVLSWSDEYYSGTGINTFHVQDALILSRDALTTPVEHYIDPSASSQSLWPGDIDGDGDVDLVTTHQSSGEFIWWENYSGPGLTWIEHLVDTVPDYASFSYPADIDGDGHLDILGTDQYSEIIIWSKNVDGAGLVWQTHIVEESFSDPYSIFSEDIDGDGDMDIICGCWMPGDGVSWWENLDGSGTSWLEHSLGGEGILSVHSKDIDGDGDMDILSAAWMGPYLIWWENSDGAGTTWIEHTFPVVSHFAFAEDVDVDGDMDIFHNNCPGGGIGWFENQDGSGSSWALHEINSSYVTHESSAADLDGDGDIDYLGGQNFSDDISWFENVDGIGQAWQIHQVSGTSSSWKAFCGADVNCDGYNEYISVGGPLSWWDITEYSTCGELVSSALYLGNDPGWGSIDWTCQEPSGTSVSFQVRACDSPDSTGMGAWSDTLHAPCSLYGIVDENDSYFQYKAILRTSDPSVTAVLEDVTITWDPLGIEGGDPAALQLLPFAPNPTSGSPVIRFSLAESASVELEVFDISGRVIIEIGWDESLQGYHDVQLEELSPGIYFCRMISGDFSATQRFVVIQ